MPPRFSTLRGFTPPRLVVDFNRPNGRDSMRRWGKCCGRPFAIKARPCETERIGSPATGVELTRFTTASTSGRASHASSAAPGRSCGLFRPSGRRSSARPASGGVRERRACNSCLAVPARSDKLVRAEDESTSSGNCEDRNMKYAILPRGGDWGCSSGRLGLGGGRRKRRPTEQQES